MLHEAAREGLQLEPFEAAVVRVDSSLGDRESVMAARAAATVLASRMMTAVRSGEPGVAVEIFGRY